MQNLPFIKGVVMVQTHRYGGAGVRTSLIVTRATVAHQLDRKHFWEFLHQ
jgi:hypothetical protein